MGLCGVLAAKGLGTECIIILGRHESRLDIARRFGATDVVSRRGEEAIAAVKENDPEWRRVGTGVCGQ